MDYEQLRQAVIIKAAKAKVEFKHKNTTVTIGNVLDRLRPTKSYRQFLQELSDELPAQVAPKLGESGSANNEAAEKRALLEGFHKESLDWENTLAAEAAQREEEKRRKSLLETAKDNVALKQMMSKLEAEVANAPVETKLSPLV